MCLVVLSVSVFCCHVNLNIVLSAVLFNSHGEFGEIKSLLLKYKIIKRFFIYPK